MLQSTSSEKWKKSYKKTIAPCHLGRSRDVLQVLQVQLSLKFDSYRNRSRNCLQLEHVLHRSRTFIILLNYLLSVTGANLLHNKNKSFDTSFDFIFIVIWSGAEKHKMQAAFCHEQ